VASYFAAPLLVRARRGLIAFVSSFGSSCYMHGPAYGAQKAGVDKFAADMAVDLAPYAVATASLWLGPQLTERTAAAARSRPEQYAAFLRQAETPQFHGRIIHALASEPELMCLSGQASDIGRSGPSLRHYRGGRPRTALVPRDARRAAPAASGKSDVKCAA
jgi:NAD(P)-dependent dehydrogenase (short-subunit alcohol dehydrogenase family)